MLPFKKNLPDFFTIYSPAFQSGTESNIIAVDWEKLNSPRRSSDWKYAEPTVKNWFPGYPQVLLNKPVVAKRVAEFLAWMVDEVRIISFWDVHIVGHSLVS